MTVFTTKFSNLSKKYFKSSEPLIDKKTDNLNYRVYTQWPVESPTSLYILPGQTVGHMNIQFKYGAALVLKSLFIEMKNIRKEN